MRFPAGFLKSVVVLSLFAAALVAAGCQKLDPTYYTRPDSPGYHEQVFTAHCPICGDVFKHSQAEWDEGKATACPLHRGMDPNKSAKINSKAATQDLKNIRDNLRAEQQNQRMQNAFPPR